jgi:legumain
MLRSLVCLSIVLTLWSPLSAHAANWGVVVAGSNQFYNYRHQADACHAFHVLSSHGVPPKNTIVMVYDDIASDPENPYPGKMFNKPTAAGTPGVDVYAGCQKDYTGDDVTAENFLNVLTGNSTGTGKKVLHSKSGDNVFIFFTDHGGTGIIAFPTGPFLQSNDLNNALTYMHNNKMFGKLVFYLEACESGSMFDGLLDPKMNIYATTASNPDESSWGTYCPPDDMIDGVEIGSCLGDLYSVSWMEDADRQGSMSESLETQYETVQQETTESHVMQYGELDWDNLPIGDFEGGKGIINRISQIARGPRNATAPIRRHTNVDSRDNKLHYLYWKYTRAKTPADSRRWGRELKGELKHRLHADQLFADFARAIVGVDNYEPVLHDRIASPAHCDQCCRKLFETVRTQCGGWSDYMLKYTRTVVNLCDAVHHGLEETDQMARTIVSLCKEREL